MTSTAEQQAQQKLDELSSGFAAWRAGKRHSKEKVPMELLTQAQQLTGVLNASAVRKRLGLSRETLQRADADKVTLPVSAPAFAELQLPHPGHPPSLRVEIHTATGEFIVISNLSIGSPSDLVARLLA